MTSAPGSLLLRDARVLSPGDPPSPWRGDVRVERGRIASLHPGGRSSPRGAEVRDLAGRWLLPAFCDSHLHLHTLAEQRAVVRLARSTSPAELADRLAAASAGAQGWVVAQGWADPLADQLAPSPREFLDARIPGRPVWAFAYDHHRAILSSAALAAVGIDPRGSDGVLLESALEEAWRAVPERPADVRVAIRWLHCHGIAAATSFDGSGARERCRRAVEEEGHRLRLRHSIPLAEFRRRAAGGDLPRPGRDREAPFLAPWVKLFLDGTLGSRTAWLKAPYSDQGGCGDERIGEEERRELARAIAESGYGACLHAIGDAACAAAIRFIAELGERRGPGVGAVDRIVDRIEHGELLDPDDLDGLARSGAVVSMQPCHLLDDASTAPERWGARCRGAFAARSLLERGIPLVLGSDAPIETVDPWIDLRAAVDRIDRGGRFPGGWIPDERISFSEALAARTSRAAPANLLPAGWGRVEPGAPADLQILECEAPERVSRIGEAGLVGLLVAGEWQDLAAAEALEP